LTLFSGDAFSPSVLSRIFEGEQMVHCLNRMGVDVACYGNHEFDYDIDHTIGLATKCNFPWLMGNLLDLRTGKPLGDGKESMIF
jgi:5'-nucleotidase